MVGVHGVGYRGGGVHVWVGRHGGGPGVDE